jgi:tetratricopeptide (TPR) repeat protein
MFRTQHTAADVENFPIQFFRFGIVSLMVETKRQVAHIRQCVLIFRPEDSAGEGNQFPIDLLRFVPAPLLEQSVYPDPAPLGPIYFRGYAYLGTGQNQEAAAEFQRILDNRGTTLNSPIGSLAHLGLARALAAAGDKDKARTAYQDFFALWKDADPDIPILIAAKAEYAKLK